MNLENTLQTLSIQDAEETAINSLLANLGFVIYFAELPVPTWPFVALGFAIADLVSLFGSGRPKFQDTDTLITAYQQSAYWPLHSLASDLQIAAKNGAPISDSNPTVQAQFSAWKQGTITSIQSLANQTPGPTGPGYWQLQDLINLSWVYSAQGSTATLKVVKAIDQFTIGLSLLGQPAPTSTPVTTPTTGTGPQQPGSTTTPGGQTGDSTTNPSPATQAVSPLMITRMKFSTCVRASAHN